MASNESVADVEASTSLLGRVVPEPLRSRYAAKFAVLILVVVAVIALVGVYGYQQADRTVERSISTQLQETSELRADSLRQWVESMRVQTRSVSAGAPLVDGDTPGAYLTSAQSRLTDDVLSVHLVDDNEGVVAASTETPLEGRALSELPGSPAWVDAAVSTGSVSAADQVWTSSRSYRSPVLDDEPVIAFASAVPGREGQFVVVVSRVQRFLDTVETADGRETTIVNERGQTVLDPDGTYDPARHGDAVAAVRGGETASDFRIGDDRVHAYASVDGTDWVTIASVDTDQAFAVRDTVGQNVLLIVLSGLFALGVVGAVLGRQTVTPLADLRGKADRMKAGDLDVDLRSARTDEIGQLYDAFDEMRNSLRDRIEEAERAREDAERAREDAEQLSRHLQAKATDYRDVMRSVADGNLSRRVDPGSESEAMTEIGEEFNEMAAAFEATVARLRSFAADVAAASEQVAASAEEVQSASQEVSTSVQAISDGATQQNDQFQSVSSEMESLSTATEQIASLATQVASRSAQTADTGSEAREAAQKAIADIRTVRQDSERAVSEMDQLDEEMAAIDDLTEFIDDLAEQTNMLALNANIEASRGGDGGDDDGFAVVAEEIRELADQTRAATDDIETRLERVHDQTETTTDAVQQAADQVTTLTETIQQTTDALDEIAGNAEDTNRGVQEIQAATQQQAASTQEVVAMVDQAASISDRTATEAERVAASAEEQTSAMAQVSESASGLARRANRLDDTLDRFDVDLSSVDADDGDVDVVDIDADDLDVFGDETTAEADDGAGADRETDAAGDDADGDADDTA